MSDGRDLNVAKDAGGGGAGGGSSGAGGGSWSVVGRGGGLPEEPDNDDRAAPSTREYDLDRFNDRTVAPPSRDDGDVIFGGAFGDPLVVSRGIDLDETTIEGPTVDLTPTVLWVRSTIGQADGGYIPPNIHRGWWEQETWWGFTVPTHPGAMAGITCTVATFAATGYAAAAGVEIEVVASATIPTDVRQGTPVAAGPAGTVSVFIPASLVPAAGDTLYVGVRPRWQANYGAWSAHFTWPWLSSSSQLDSGGVAYQGRSGKAQGDYIADATWQIWVSGDTDIGSTSAMTDDDAPFDGGFPWLDAGESGSPIIELDPSEGLSVEATPASAKGWKIVGPDEDDEADDGGWSTYEGWRVDALFKTSAVGNVGQAGRRALELVIIGAGQRSVVAAHLGDGVRAAGVSADGGGVVDYEAVTIAANTLYWLVADIRAGYVRGKLWQATGGLTEPVRFNVEAELLNAPTEEGDRFEMWFKVGNVIGAQRLVVRRLRQFAAAKPGEVVAGELIGYSAGTSAEIKPAHQYVPGSLVVTSLGGVVVPPRQWGDEARAKLDYKPPASAIIRARYVVAAALSDDEEGYEDE